MARLICIPQDDLMAELEDLEQEELDEKLLDVGPGVTDQLPSVPTAEPVKPKAGMLHFNTPKLRDTEPVVTTIIMSAKSVYRISTNEKSVYRIGTDE